MNNEVLYCKFIWHGQRIEQWDLRSGWGSSSSFRISQMSLLDTHGQFQECHKNLEPRGSAELNHPHVKIELFSVCWMRQISFPESGECHQCLTIVLSSFRTAAAPSQLCRGFIFSICSHSFCKKIRKHGNMVIFWTLGLQNVCSSIYLSMWQDQRGSSVCSEEWWEYFVTLKDILGQWPKRECTMPLCP